MTELQAQIILNFIDENWTAFESMAIEFDTDPEDVRTMVERVALGE